MREFEIQKIKSEKYIVLSTSYVSPLDEIEILQQELTRLNFEGELVIDLLLCNGISDNRYVVVYFNGKYIDFSKLQVAPKVDDEVSKKSREFYMTHKELLVRGILPDAHIYIVSEGLI